MKIYNEIILQWDENTNQFDTIYEDSFDYSGELILFQNGEETPAEEAEVEEIEYGYTPLFFFKNHEMKIEKPSFE